MSREHQEIWCQPSDQLKRQFMVLFDDPSQEIAVFDDETEARKFWNSANIDWSCYLFGVLPRVQTQPDYECEDCIGMKEHGCYCQTMGAAAPGGRDTMKITEKLQAAYDKVKEWPEHRMSEDAVLELGEGFTDLLALRNLVPEAIAAADWTPRFQSMLTRVETAEAEADVLRADRENLHIRVRELRATITTLMAKLADLLDEDHFHACEDIVRKAGIEAPEPFPQPNRNDGGTPCGECHLNPGETCDICGARTSSKTAQPAAWNVHAKGWGEELRYTADGAKELADRLRTIEGVKEPTITPLYAGPEQTNV